MNWTILGLILDAVGVIMVFYFTPERYPDPQWSASFAVEGESKKARERWLKQQPKRRRIVIVGVALIVIGFVFQAFGEILSC